MAQEIFEKHEEVLKGLVQAVEIINTQGKSPQFGLWKGDENLSHNLLQLKQQSERLSSSCTKVGLVRLILTTMNSKSCSHRE
jgi:hypothetical protein